MAAFSNNDEAIMIELSFPRDTISPGARDIYKARAAELIGHNDRMDEAPRTVRVSDTDAVPFVGPRGGIRRITTVLFRDDVCEDGDAEDAMIARLDGPGDGDDGRDDEDRDEREWDDEDGDDGQMMVGGIPLEEYLALQRLDVHVTVNGAPVSAFIERHDHFLPDHGIGDVWFDEVSDAEATQAELEERARPETRKGTWPNRLLNKAGNRHRAWKTVRCGGRGKRYSAKRRIGVPHAKPTGDSQRRETLTSRFGGASIRTQAFDRMSDVDPWTVHVALASEEEEHQTTIVREEWQLEYELRGYYEYYHANGDDDHEYAAADLADMAKAIDRVGCTDTVRALWIDGRLTECLELIGSEPVGPLTTAESSALLDRTYPFNVLCGDASIPDDLGFDEWDDGEPADFDPPRESGEFGRAFETAPGIELDAIDDLRPYQRLATAAEAERDPSFLRRRSN